MSRTVIHAFVGADSTQIPRARVDLDGFHGAYLSSRKRLIAASSRRV